MILVDLALIEAGNVLAAWLRRHASPIEAGDDGPIVDRYASVAAALATIRPALASGLVAPERVTQATLARELKVSTRTVRRRERKKKLGAAPSSGVIRWRSRGGAA
jgi:hypothetical protein